MPIQDIMHGASAIALIDEDELQSYFLTSIEDVSTSPERANNIITDNAGNPVHGYPQTTSLSVTINARDVPPRLAQRMNGMTITDQVAVAAKAAGALTLAKGSGGYSGIADAIAAATLNAAAPAGLYIATLKGGALVFSRADARNPSDVKAPVWSDIFTGSAPNITGAAATARASWYFSVNDPHGATTSARGMNSQAVPLFTIIATSEPSPRGLTARCAISGMLPQPVGKTFTPNETNAAALTFDATDISSYTETPAPGISG